MLHPEEQSPLHLPAQPLEEAFSLITVRPLSVFAAFTISDALITVPLE
nr:MAG TPA: hypothetical protein [Caudoviricetes sp.]